MWLHVWHTLWMNLLAGPWMDGGCRPMTASTFHGLKGELHQQKELEYIISMAWIDLYLRT